jgi:hypothetical protein
MTQNRVSLAEMNGAGFFSVMREAEGMRNSDIFVQVTSRLCFQLFQREGRRIHEHLDGVFTAPRGPFRQRPMKSPTPMDRYQIEAFL